MKTTCGRMLPVVAVLVAVAVAAHAAAIDPLKAKKGQETHLFEAMVRVPDNGVEDLEEYNYSPKCSIASNQHGARCMRQLGAFSAFITNNQARRLSKVPGVLKVRRLEDPPALPETDEHL